MSTNDSMQLDRHKLKSVIIYACGKYGPSKLGAVKLNKVLYFCDMLCFSETGHPLMGATYRKRPFGPTCDQLLQALRELSREGSLKIDEVDYFGYRKKEFIPKVAPDISRFSDSERELLDAVIEFVCLDHSAKTISDFSHNRVWEMADFGEVLPYSSVFQIFPTEVSLEAQEWAMKEGPAIEAERSRTDPLDYVTYVDFRSRVLQAWRS